MKSFLFFASIFYSTITVLGQYPQNYFSSPLDIPLVLSGTFGELRSNHFHTGMDLKTQGVEGKNILASADGYVSRINVSPWGYGNAIYIAHPNGFTTVYGHLKEFSPEIQAYVKKAQLSQKKYAVELYPESHLFPVKKGNIVALSGNSGGSGGPHLHFEIRDSKNSEPINPLLFGFGIQDNRNPMVQAIYFYKFDSAQVENMHLERKRLSVTQINDTLYNLGNLKSFGSVAFGIQTIDKLNGAENQNGPYLIEFFIDSNLSHSFKAERLNFSRNRYLNAHIDYDLYQNGGPKINRNFNLPGNELRMYPKKNTHHLNLQLNKTHQLHWIVTDVAQNKTHVTGTITGIEPNTILKSEGNFMKYDVDNYFKSDFIEVAIPKGSLYQNIDFKHNVVAPCFNGIGSAFEIGYEGIPLQNYATLKIKVEQTEGLDFSKLIAVRLNNSCRATNEGGSFENGWLSFRVRQLGKFGVMIDTMPPVIKPLTLSKSFKLNQEIGFVVTDDLSGVDQYNAYIDGNWVLLEYNPKKAKFYYTCNEELTPGLHSFEIKVKDERKNLKTFSFQFEYL